MGPMISQGRRFESESSQRILTPSPLVLAIQVNTNTSLRLVFPSPRHHSFRTSTLVAASAVDFGCAASLSLASPTDSPPAIAFRLLLPTPSAALRLLLVGRGMARGRMARRLSPSDARILVALKGRRSPPKGLRPGHHVILHLA